MSPPLRRLLPLLLCAPLGCGVPEPPAGGFPDRAVVVDGGVDAEDSGVAAGELTDPAGQWLLWRETVTCVTVLGTSFEMLAESLSVVTVVPVEGGGLEHRQRVCQLRQTPVVGLQTSFSDHLAESIPEQRWFGLLSGSAPGSDYRTAQHVELWATTLDDPEHDPLPTTVDDPRVYDMDGDGHPGATLTLGDDLCQLYVVQRGLSRWQGQVVDGVRLEGSGISRSEQVVLDATSGFCATRYDVRYMDGANRFVMVRADGREGSLGLDADGDGDVSCAEARAYGIEPFGPRPPDNARCR